MGDSVRIESAAGGRTYLRTEPTGGELLGPEAVRRRTLAALRHPGDRLVYRSFPAELGIRDFRQLPGQPYGPAAV